MYLVVVACLGVAVPGPPFFVQERFRISCLNSRYCVCGVLPMRRSWTPSIVPNGHDQTFYIVINNYGELDPAFAETDLGEADLETTITDLMSGQYSDPLRVVAFKTAD